MNICIYILYTWSPNDLYFWGQPPKRRAFSDPKEGSFGLQLLQEEQPLEVTGSTAAEPVETEVPVEDPGSIMENSWGVQIGKVHPICMYVLHIIHMLYDIHLCFLNCNEWRYTYIYMHHNTHTYVYIYIYINALQYVYKLYIYIYIMI